MVVPLPVAVIAPLAETLLRAPVRFVPTFPRARSVITVLPPARTSDTMLLRKWCTAC